jgi:signal transduction histidine kinase
MGFAEILSLGVYGPLLDEQQNALRQISASTEELLNLVNQLLDQAQIEAGRLRLNVATYSIREVIERVQIKMQVLADARGLQLTSGIDPDLPDKITGDSTRITQILINLVSNAIKFTEQGQVTIRALRRDTTRWQLEVADTGSGIPAHVQEAIFEPFRLADSSATRIFRGSGLGLSIVRELTHLMGGEIALESEVGKGTTFFITLPLAHGK